MVVVTAMVAMTMGRVVTGFAMFMVMAVVMTVSMVFRGQEIGVDIEFGVQVKAAQVKKVFDCDIAKVHLVLRRARVHVFEAVH
jgi:hypothetical protein